MLPLAKADSSNRLARNISLSSPPSDRPHCLLRRVLHVKHPQLWLMTLTSYVIDRCRPSYSTNWPISSEVPLVRQPEHYSFGYTWNILQGFLESSGRSCSLASELSFRSSVYCNHEDIQRSRFRGIWHCCTSDREVVLMTHRYAFHKAHYLDELWWNRHSMWILTQTPVHKSLSPLGVHHFWFPALLELQQLWDHSTLDVTLFRTIKGITLLDFGCEFTTTKYWSTLEMGDHGLYSRCCRISAVRWHLGYL